MANPERPGDIRQRLPSLPPRQRLPPLITIEDRRPSYAPNGPLPTFPGASLDQFPLELCNPSQHGQHQAPVWRDGVRPALEARDGDSYPSRFPLDAVPTVRRRLAELFVKEARWRPSAPLHAVLTSLALEEAERLELRRRIVLPFSPNQFRESSVIDRRGG